MATRDTNTSQLVPSPLQRQRLRGLKHPNGEARTTQTRDCLLRLLMEHRRRRSEDCDVVFQPLLRGGRDPLRLRRDGRQSATTQSQRVHGARRYVQHDNERPQCHTKEDSLVAAQNRASDAG